MIRQLTLAAGLISIGALSFNALAEDPRRGFSKTIERDGRLAERTTTVKNDRTNKTRTRSVEGKRLNGNIYSAERVTQRTTNGYNRSLTRTNANGDTATRYKSVVIDREAGTRTKTIDRVGFNGKSSGRTVTIQRH